MLLPRKTKFRKQHRGRRAGTSKGQTTVNFGDFGLKSLDAGWVTTLRLEPPSDSRTAGEGGSS